MRTPAIAREAPAVELRELTAERYEDIFLGYADRGIERLRGAHYYEFSATSPGFSDLRDTDPSPAPESEE